MSVGVIVCCSSTESSSSMVEPITLSLIGMAVEVGSGILFEDSSSIASLGRDCSMASSLTSLMGSSCISSSSPICSVSEELMGSSRGVRSSVVRILAVSLWRSLELEEGATTVRRRVIMISRVVLKVVCIGWC